MSDKKEVSNVYAFPYGNLSPDTILETLRGIEFRSLVIIGELPCGCIHITATTDSRPEMNYMMDRAKIKLMTED